MAELWSRKEAASPSSALPGEKNHYHVGIHDIDDHDYDL